LDAKTTPQGVTIARFHTMLDSPRKPSRTMRIFSSAEYCLRVARRMLFTRRSDGELGVADFCLISVPSG
jgi:hypothetical protein